MRTQTLFPIFIALPECVGKCDTWYNFWQNKWGGIRTAQQTNLSPAKGEPELTPRFQK